MKGISTLIVLFMATQIMVAQEQSMQQFISKEKSAFVANISPYKTFKKLDTATTNKFNVSKMLAPMLLGMAGGEMTEEKIKKIEEGLADTKNIGLEIQKEVYIWVQKPDDPADEVFKGEPNPFFFNMVLPITDGDKFKVFLEDLFGKEKINNMTSTGDAMSMVHNKMLLNWNKNRLILAGSTVQESFFEESEQFAERNKKMLLQHANVLGKVTEATSIAKDADYQKHLHEGADFDIWADYNNLMPSTDEFPSQARELAQSLLDFIGDMKLGGNGFIKKGEGQFLMELYSNDAMGRVMAEATKVKLNKNFFKYIDNTNLMGMFSMSMGVSGFMKTYATEIYKVLETTKEGTLITNLLDIIDIFVDEEEIYNLFKGDFLMAFTDLKIIERKTSDFEYNEDTDKWEEVSSTTKDVIPMVAMMMSYGSEENIMKFVTLASNAGVISKKSDGVWAIGGVKEELGFDIFIIVKDGILMFTNDENIPNNIKSGLAKDKLISSKDVKLYTSYVQYGFSDIGKVATNLKKVFAEMDKTLPRGIGSIEAAFKSIEFKMFAPKGNEFNSEFNLKMTDPEANVLQIMMDGILRMNSFSSSSKEESIEEISPVDDDGSKKL